MIGYHTSYDHNLVGMAMTQGRREDVVNIGVGIKELTAPPGMSANDFAISLYHKVRHIHAFFLRKALSYPGLFFCSSHRPSKPSSRPSRVRRS